MTKRQPKAKTAYELLERVCQHILEEPKRYYQAVWGIVGKKRIANVCGDHRVPDCGTVGCRAGWIVALHDGRKRLATLSEGRQVYVATRANDILGLHQSETCQLFDGGAVRGTAGTKAYASKGVKGLRAFMKQHAAHLKARSLKGV